MATRLQLLRVLPALLGLGYSLPAAAATTVPEQLIGITRDFLEQAVTTHLERSEIQARHEIEIQQIDPRLRLQRIRSRRGTKRACAYHSAIRA